jgi:virginiamycin B lyase
MTPEFREHRIPSAGSRPYILAVGADGVVEEFALRDPACHPVGIVTGDDGALWFTEVEGNAIGRITMDGDITEYPLPTPQAGPNGMVLGPDGNVWFAEHKIGKVGRITPGGVITEFGGFAAGGKPLAPTAMGEFVWFSDSVASRIARVDMTGRVVEHALRPGSGPRAIVPAPDGNLCFVLAEGNAIGRLTPDGALTEFALPRPGSSPRGIVVANGDEIWFTENAVNLIGRMNLAGELLAEYEIPTPGSGGRAMVALSETKLFFGQHDVGQICEMTLSEAVLF